MKRLPVLLAALGLIILGGCDETLIRVPDTTGPAVLITYPVPGNPLTAPVDVLIEAADPDSIARVSLLVDGEPVGVDTLPPWRIAWNINYWHDTPNHSLVAKAVDRSGNVGLSEMVLVTVDTGALAGPAADRPLDGEAFDTPALQLAWAAYGDAVRYEVQTASTDLFTDPLVSTGTPATMLDVVAPGDGLYYWRVRAVDARDAESPWSAPRSFRVDIPVTPDDLMADFFAAYAGRDSSRYDLMLHPDFEYRYKDTFGVVQTFERADELRCAGHIFSGTAGLNSQGDPYAPVTRLDVTYSLYGGEWTTLTPSDPDFVDIPDARMGIFTVLLEARVPYVNLIHSTLEKIIVVPAEAGSDDAPVTRWILYSQQEMGGWPLKSAPRLWSELKLDYF